MNKNNTIEGTTFFCLQCERRGETTRFIAGSRGMAALDGRVIGHMNARGHYELMPINPKVGMVFVNLNDDSQIVGAPYDGGNVAEWFESVKRAAIEVRNSFKPRWDLFKGGEANEETSMAAGADTGSDD